MAILGDMAIMVEMAIMSDMAIMHDMAILGEMAIMVEMAIMSDMAIVKKSLKVKNRTIKISFRCVKLRENPENQSFTFFAFLPPYIGVSDSLAYPIGKNLSRSIDWYKKFLISCLVARYSAVFVLKSMEVGIGMGVVLSARSFM